MMVNPKPMLLFWSDVDKKLPFSCVGSRVNSGFSGEDKCTRTDQVEYFRCFITRDLPSMLVRDSAHGGVGGMAQACPFRYGCSHRKTGRV